MQITKPHPTPTQFNIFPNFYAAISKAATVSMNLKLTQLNAMQRDATRCNAMQCNTMQCDAMQYDAVRWNAMQSNAMQHYVVHANIGFPPAQPTPLVQFRPELGIQSLRPELDIQCLEKTGYDSEGAVGSQILLNWQNQLRQRSLIK